MILALSGYARSGKDSAGEILVERYGFQRIAFADALKELALKINGALAEDVAEFGWEQAKGGGWLRKLLQDLGVGVRDVLSEDAWIDVVLHKIKDAHALGQQRFVVTDVRFPNEAHVLGYHRLLPSKVVRINRPGVGPANGHVSETALDDWPFDFVLENDGDLGDLGRRVDDLMTVLGLAPCEKSLSPSTSRSLPSASSSPTAA